MTACQKDQDTIWLTFCNYQNSMPSKRVNISTGHILCYMYPSHHTLTVCVTSYRLQIPLQIFQTLFSYRPTKLSFITAFTLLKLWHACHDHRSNKTLIVYGTVSDQQEILKSVFIMLDTTSNTTPYNQQLEPYLWIIYIVLKHLHLNCMYTF